MFCNVVLPSLAKRVYLSSYRFVVILLFAGEIVSDALLSESSALPASAKTKSFTLLDLVLGVLLVVFALCLMINCYVLCLAQEYNNSICKQAAYLAADAAREGRATDEVKRAAFRAMDKCGTGGFFINSPEMVVFADEISPRQRVVTIATSCGTYLPAPFLVNDASIFDRETYRVNVRSSYVFKLNNPKNCQGTHMFFGNDGKVAPIYKERHPVKNEAAKAPATNAQKEAAGSVAPVIKPAAPKGADSHSI